MYLMELMLSLNKNKKIAIVGPSGSGKSTLLGLMIRLFDFDKGKIVCWKRRY